MGPPSKRQGYSRNIVEPSGRSGTIFTCRGLLNLGGVGILCSALVMLFAGTSPKIFPKPCTYATRSKGTRSYRTSRHKAFQLSARWDWVERMPRDRSGIRLSPTSKFKWWSFIQVPMIAGYRGLIDEDTPDDMLTRTGFDGRVCLLSPQVLPHTHYDHSQDYQLVFSDEVRRTLRP